MIRRFGAYVLEFKDSDGFIHDWCTLILALESAYKTSIHASTGKAPAMLEKGWSPKLPVDTLKKDLVDIHPTASSFSHKTPEFKVGDLILVSTLNFNNIKVPNKLKDSFAGPFLIKALHGKNAVQVELSVELENKNPTFTSEKKEVLKVLKARRLRGKDEREYLVGYKNPQHEDEWIVAEKIPDSKNFLEDSDMREDQFLNEKSELYALHTCKY
ncbi:hypothetical protein O181_107123, partial [Austropuccinia psidii MF-1]|nr:hypothetical protein [Austropuccinia psidii MF-1]